MKSTKGDFVFTLLFAAVVALVIAWSCGCFQKTPHYTPQQIDAMIKQHRELSRWIIDRNQVPSAGSNDFDVP